MNESNIKIGGHTLREWGELIGECERVTSTRDLRRVTARAPLGCRPTPRLVAAATTRSRPSDEPTVVLTRDDEAIIATASITDPRARDKFIAARRRQLVEGRRPSGSDRPR